MELKYWLETDSKGGGDGGLLVLDDVRKETWQQTQSIIPTVGSNCKVLITTRAEPIADALLSSSEKDRCREIRILDLKSAADMFFQISGISPCGNEQDKVMDLVKSLGGLPLAVESAAYFARTCGLDTAWKERTSVGEVPKVSVIK